MLWVSQCFIKWDVLLTMMKAVQPIDYDIYSELNLSYGVKLQLRFKDLSMVLKLMQTSAVWWAMLATITAVSL